MQTAKSIDERAGETHKGRTRVPRTKTTRALALLLALILLGGLVWWTWRKTGNPLIAWYTEQKITAHYRAYHPGEGYVVGPARYQWVVRADKSAGMDYVCTVRKEASEDVEFPAYFSDGAVFSQIDGAVRSGCNTYERFKNLLNSELESGGTAARLRALTGEAEVHAGFYTTQEGVPFPVSWTVKMKKKQKETQDILSYHTQAAGCSDKARAKASGGRQPIEECGRTGL